MLKLILPWFFQLSTWTSLQKTFSLVSSAYMYGCQWCFEHVLCSTFIFAKLSIFVCHWQNVDKININYLFILPCVFLACYRLYITVPIFLYFCFLLAQLWINFGQISVYHTLCLPCILHVHYWAYCWLCQFALLDSCKRPTQDGLFGLVSYRVPLALRQSIL